MTGLLLVWFVLLVTEPFKSFGSFQRNLNRRYIASLVIGLLRGALWFIARCEDLALAVTLDWLDFILTPKRNLVHVQN